MHSPAIFVIPTKNLMIAYMAKLDENAQIVPNNVNDPMPMKNVRYRPILWRNKKKQENRHFLSGMCDTRILIYQYTVSCHGVRRSCNALFPRNFCSYVMTHVKPKLLPYLHLFAFNFLNFDRSDGFQSDKFHCKA